MIRKATLVSGTLLAVLAVVAGAAGPISAAIVTPAQVVSTDQAAAPDLGAPLPSISASQSADPGDLTSPYATSDQERPAPSPLSVRGRGRVDATPTPAIVGFPYAGVGATTTVVPWAYDMYDARAARWQEPDQTACTAAAALSMLNTIAYHGEDETLLWEPNVSYTRQESVLAFERAHMTMRKTSSGSDAHGWRNALNYYGWGSLDAGVYVDRTYGSLAEAQKDVVSAMAKYHKPAGILTQFGRHAQFLTGYKVVGDDPSTGSMDFRVVGVFMTDPWRSGRYRDTWVTPSTQRWGWYWLKWERYYEIDSPYRDPIDGHVGRTEWVGRWVAVVPVK